MKDVLIYSRVSKGDQNPKHQENSLREYAEKREMNIVGVYTDYITGKSSTRPELTRMISRVRDGGVDAVLVWKLDRLGRSLKHLIQVVEEFNNKGVDFICTTQDLDTTTSSGKLIFHVLGAIAEFERELISERTKNALRGNEKVGKRGKDKKQRKKSGYYARYAKDRGLL